MGSSRQIGSASRLGSRKSQSSADRNRRNEISSAQPDLFAGTRCDSGGGAGERGTAADSSDVADVWAGFAHSRTGFQREIKSAICRQHVVEAFDPPNLFQTPTFTIVRRKRRQRRICRTGRNTDVTVPLTNTTGNHGERRYA